MSRKSRFSWLKSARGHSALGLGLLIGGLAFGCSSTSHSSGASGGSANDNAGSPSGGDGNAGANGGGANNAGGVGPGGTTSNGGSSGSGGSHAGGTSIVDSPTGEAFDPVLGALNVDYAAYLSKHDVVYNKPNTNPLYGLTVGNGRVGAMVYSENGLTMQVGGVDASQQTAFSAGLVNLSTSPALDDSSSNYQQRLALYDGVLTTSYGPGRTVTVLGSPNSEVMGIHVEDSRTGLASITLDLSLWDVSALGNSGNVPDINTWKTVSTYADSDGAGLSRGQTDKNHFGYTLAATVEGAPFTTEKAGASDVKLHLTPSASYTIWVACASRLNAAGNDSVASAKALLSSTKGAGYASVAQKSRDFWHGQWAKSFVQYSRDSDPDYLENLYYLSTYIILSGGFGSYPFHFINGVFRATHDDTKWSNAYWFWNQRDVYNSFLASNHPDVLGVFNHLYSRNTVALKAMTLSRFGSDGLWVPETMGWDGNSSGNTEYTNDIFSTGTEAALNMYAQYQYTGDADYLKNTAYPFMRDVAKFYQKELTLDASGKYGITSSNAHETYWGVPNAITDLAAVRSLYPATIQASTTLGLDADLRPAWQAILDKLAPLPTDATDYLPHQPPIAQTHNNENVASEIIWPYSTTGIDAPDYARALSTWQHRPFPYGNVWANDAIQAARLGLGDEALKGMVTMLQKYQSYPNAFTNNTNGVYEFLGVHLGVMNESLLQSYNGKIRVFPALPSDASFIGRFTLAAVGGFLVSSERESGQTKYVGLKSLLGNAATLINPWGSEAVDVRKMSDGSIVSNASSAEITFTTEANAVYVVERVAKPFSGYTFAYLTGTANQDAKHLNGSACTLGIASKTPTEMGIYEAESATLTNCAISNDGAASGGAEVTNISPGSAVTFKNVRAGTTLDIHYCTKNVPSQLTLYVNGAKNQAIPFTSTNSWDTTYATKTVSVTIPTNATLTLQNDPGDSGANLDYIQIK